MDQSKIQAYASTFVTYLIRSLKEKINKIDAIILYGSVAKQQATLESDVDIFIDTKDTKLMSYIETYAAGFMESREAALYKMEGISNQINIKIGKLSLWKDLNHSIINSGILLWGKYQSNNIPNKTNHYILFYWNVIEKNRGAFLNTLYGYSMHNKKYKGLLTKLNGSKIGKSSILIPAKDQEKIIILFKKYKVHAKQKELFLYE